MPVYTIELDGKQYDLEGDHAPSEAEARAAIGPAQPQPKATPAPASATIGMMAQSTQQPKPQASLMDRFLYGRTSVTDPATGNEVPIKNDPGLIVNAAPTGISAIALAKGVPGVIARAAGISGTRAAANLTEAAAAAKDAIVGTEALGKEGLRAMELQQSGGRMPRVASQLMQRITNPDAGDLTFGEARDFYSNLSRMSANEFNSLNPTMQRQMGAMKEALHQALTAAAETVGKGEQYASGIKEYADSARAAARWNDTIKPTLWKSLRRVADLAGIGAGYDIARRVID